MLSGVINSICIHKRYNSFYHNKQDKKIIESEYSNKGIYKNDSGSYVNEEDYKIIAAGSIIKDQTFIEEDSWDNEITY